MLWIRSKGVARLLAMSLAAGCMGGSLLAQDPSPQLESQLKTIYKLSQVEWVGNNVTQQGSVVKVAKVNLLFGTPEGQAILCAATIKQDKEQVPSSLCRLTMQSTGAFLQAGQRLFITKLKVNLPKDTVSLELAESAVNPNTGAPIQPTFKTAVNFVFSAGYLSKADAGQIADAINNVLPMDTDNAAGAQQVAQQMPAPQVQPVAAQQPAPQAQPAAQAPAASAQVELGMTEEQVKSILGPPTSAKQPAAQTKVYVYRKQITFQDGKVAAIE